MTGKIPWNKGLRGLLIHSSESKSQISKTSKERWSDPTYKKRVGLATSLGKRGIPQSIEMREKIAVGHKFNCTCARHKTPVHKGKCKCARCSIRSPSSNTWKLTSFLQGVGFDNLVPEAQFGPYRVDVLLADEWIAFEADGDYWHSLPGRKEYDKQRDQFLFEEFQLPIVRLSQDDVDAMYVLIDSLMKIRHPASYSLAPQRAKMNMR